MIRPECYECAACGSPWSTYFPRVVCSQCGWNVLRRVRERSTTNVASRAGVAVAIEFDDLADMDAPVPEVTLDLDAAWSPYSCGCDHCEQKGGCDDPAH